MEKETKGIEFKKFATPRIIGGIAIVVIVLWALTIILGPSEGLSPKHQVAGHDSAAATAHKDDQRTDHPPPVKDTPAESQPAAAPAKNGDSHTVAGRTQSKARDDHAATTEKAEPGHGKAEEKEISAASAEDRQTRTDAPAAAELDAGAAGHSQDQPAAATADTHGKAVESRAPTGHLAGESKEAGHDAPAGHPIDIAPAHKPIPKGVAFVEATIKPLQFELEERWWGWRPNDLIDVTDNINNFQLGVLEVTRRTAVALGERISRHGSTDAFDENLENAMNWFMVKAKSYWFPSAESKYRDGLEELAIYLEKLEAGEATFYTRADNLIPLLASFEDLLGSCDENLVKQFNEDGTPVSFFAVDNYFYYTQGVASAMASVLEAIHHDFLIILESRDGTELLHHAIESCHWATKLDPWIILDRNLSSVFANHRANMAAPISHARFFIGQLIKTLST